MDAKHSKIQAQLVQRDGTGNWGWPKARLTLLLGAESSLLLRRKSSLWLRLIKLYRDGSCWDKRAFWARLRCNIYRSRLFWTTLRLGTELSTTGGWATLGTRAGGNWTRGTLSISTA